MKNSKLEVKRRFWGVSFESLLPVVGEMAVLLIVATALLWPAPVDSNQLFAAQLNSDLLISHWPTALLIQGTFAQSHTLPLWNPYFGGGQPLGADPLAALFYPPTHLLHFLSLRDYYLVLIMGHLFWAGLGMLLLARRAVGLPRLPALVAAVAFMATPRLSSHLGAGHVTLVQTVAWYPWLALACWATVRAPGRWGVALGMCIAMTLLAGHPQMAYYGLLMVAALAVWLLVKRGRLEGWRALVAPLAGLAAAGVVGALLAAVHLLPLLEFTAYSTRQLSLSSQDAYPFLGFLQALIVQPSPAGSTWEGLISPGLIVLALAAVAIIARWRVVWQLVLGIVLVAGLALGVASPFYLLMAHILPELDLFRAPARIWFVALMLIALLAGLSVDALMRATRRISSRGVAVAGLLAISLVAVSLIVSDTGYARIGDVNALTAPSALARMAAQLAGSGRVYGVQENIPQLYAVELQVPFADGWNPLLIESYVAYMQRAGGYDGGGYQLHIPYDSPSVQPDARLLGLMNVSVVVSRRPLTDARLALVGEADGTLIYQNSADAGPAYLVMPGTTGKPPTLDQLQRLDGGVRVLTLLPEQETFTFTNSATAYFVIAMPAFPGWVAELDGRPAAIQQIAGVLPAIEVEPGTHTLSYTYAPTSVRLGALLSAVGVLAVLAWLLAGHLWKPLQKGILQQAIAS